MLGGAAIYVAVLLGAWRTTRRPALFLWFRIIYRIPHREESRMIEQAKGAANVSAGHEDRLTLIGRLHSPINVTLGPVLGPEGGHALIDFPIMPTWATAPSAWRGRLRPHTVVTSIVRSSSEASNPVSRYNAR